MNLKMEAPSHNENTKQKSQKVYYIVEQCPEKLISRLLSQWRNSGLNRKFFSRFTFIYLLFLNNIYKPNDDTKRRAAA